MVLKINDFPGAENAFCCKVEEKKCEQDVISLEYKQDLMTEVKTAVFLLSEGAVQQMRSQEFRVINYRVFTFRIIIGTHLRIDKVQDHYMGTCIGIITHKQVPRSL